MNSNNKWLTEKSSVQLSSTKGALAALKDELVAINSGSILNPTIGVLHKSHLSKLGRFEIVSKYPTLLKDIQAVFPLIQEISSHLRLSITDILNISHFVEVSVFSLDQAVLSADTSFYFAVLFTTYLRYVADKSNAFDGLREEGSSNATQGNKTPVATSDLPWRVVSSQEKRFDSSTNVSPHVSLTEIIQIICGLKALFSGAEVKALQRVRVAIMDVLMSLMNQLFIAMKSPQSKGNDSGLPRKNSVPDFSLLASSNTDSCEPGRVNSFCIAVFDLFTLVWKSTYRVKIVQDDKRLISKRPLGGDNDHMKQVVPCQMKSFKMDLDTSYSDEFYTVAEILKIHHFWVAGVSTLLRLEGQHFIASLSVGNSEHKENGNFVLLVAIVRALSSIYFAQSVESLIVAGQSVRGQGVKSVSLHEGVPSSDDRLVNVDTIDEKNCAIDSFLPSFYLSLVQSCFALLCKTSPVAVKTAGSRSTTPTMHSRTRPTAVSTSPTDSDGWETTTNTSKKKKDARPAIITAKSSDVLSSGSIAGLVSTELFLLLSALAHYNPNSFLSHWSILMRESNVVDSNLENFVVSSVTKTQQSLASPVRYRSSMVTDHMLPKLSSLLCNTVLSPHASPSLKSAVISCFRYMIRGLSIRFWIKTFQKESMLLTTNKKFSPSKASAAASFSSTGRQTMAVQVVSSIIRILRVCSILLMQQFKDDGHSSIIHGIISSVSTLVPELPLGTMKTSGLGTPLTHSYAAGNDALAVIETSLVNVFSLTLQHSLHSPKTVAADDKEYFTFLTFIFKQISGMIAINGGSHFVALSSALQLVNVSPAADSPISSTMRRELSYCHALSLLCPIDPKLNSPQYIFNLEIGKLLVSLADNYPEALAWQPTCNTSISPVSLQVSWVREFVNKCGGQSKSSSMKLLGLELLGSLLGAGVTSTSNIRTQYGLYGLTFVDIIDHILLLSSASDHLVRAQAAHTLGKLTSIHWFELISLERSNVVYIPQISASTVTIVAKPSTPTRRPLPSVSSEIPPLSRRLHILHVLVDVLCRDTIGTVRAASYKCLGDVLCHSALSHCTKCQASSVDSNLDIAFDNTTLVQKVLIALQVGLSDTKLMVRVTAAWTLGNLLQLCLKSRRKLVECKDIAMSSMVDANSEGSYPLQSFQWEDQGSILLNLLEDSDKLLLATVRCLGLHLAGLNILCTPTHSDVPNSRTPGCLSTKAVNIISAVVSALTFRVLLGGEYYDEWQDDPQAVIHRAVRNNLPVKQTYVIANAFGIAAIVLKQYVLQMNSDASGDSSDVSVYKDIRMRAFSSLNIVCKVLAGLVRHASAKPQLSALVSLLHVLCWHDGAEGSAGNSVLLQAETFLLAVDDGIIFILESILVVAADLNERSQRSRLSVSKTVEDSQTISMVTGKRPKAVSLDSYDRQYYLLLMFYQVMNLLSVIQSKEHIEGRMVELLDIARSILLYQGDSIAVWLEDVFGYAKCFPACLQMYWNAVVGSADMSSLSVAEGMADRTMACLMQIPVRDHGQCGICDANAQDTVGLPLYSYHLLQAVPNTSMPENNCTAQILASKIALNLLGVLQQSNDASPSGGDVNAEGQGLTQSTQWILLQLASHADSAAKVERKHPYSATGSPNKVTATSSSVLYNDDSDDEEI